jgi:hypothetical protein
MSKLFPKKKKKKKKSLKFGETNHSGSASLFLRKTFSSNQKKREREMVKKAYMLGEYKVEVYTWQI